MEPNRKACPPVLVPEPTVSTLETWAQHAECKAHGWAAQVGGWLSPSVHMRPGALDLKPWVVWLLASSLMVDSPLSLI